MVKRLFLVMIIIPVVVACSSKGGSASSNTVAEAQVFAEAQLPVTLIEEIGEGSFLGDLVWSPDGTRFIGASTSGTWLFDNLEDLSASTGRLAGSPLSIQVAYSTDGQYFASVSSDYPVIDVYNGETGEHLYNINVETIDNFSAVAFHPNGETLLGLTDDGNILEFAVATGEQVRDFNIEVASPGQLIVSPDGLWIAHGSKLSISEGEDRPIGQIIDYATGEMRGLRGHTGRLSVMAFLPDNRLLTRDTNRMLKIWDTLTAEVQATFEIGVTFDSISILDDGTVVTSLGNTIDLETGEVGSLSARGIYSPDGAYTALRTTISGTNVIQVIDADSGEIMSQVDVASYSLFTLNALNNGVLLGNFPGGDDLDFWDMETHSIIGSIESPGSSFQQPVVSPDGRFVAAVVSFDNNVYVFNAETYELVYTLEGHTDAPDFVSFSADGTRLISYTIISDADPTVRVWDMTSGEQTTVLTHEAAISRAIISPDGATVVSSTNVITSDTVTNTLYVWDAATGEQRDTINTTLPISRMAFSPDGSVFVIGGMNLLARYSGYQFFDTESFKSTSDILKVTYSIVDGPVFSDDSSRMLTSTMDGNLMVWDVASQRIIAEIPGANYYSYDFVYGDNSQVVTADATGVLRLWRIGE